VRALNETPQRLSLDNDVVPRLLRPCTTRLEGEFPCVRPGSAFSARRSSQALARAVPARRRRSPPPWSPRRSHAARRPRASGRDDGDLLRECRGTAPLSYRWRKSGTTIAGATAPATPRPRDHRRQRRDLRGSRSVTPPQCQQPQCALTVGATVTSADVGDIQTRTTWPARPEPDGNVLDARERERHQLRQAALPVHDGKWTRSPLSSRHSRVQGATHKRGVRGHRERLGVCLRRGQRRGAVARVAPRRRERPVARTPAVR